jgi:hypothetical protein
VAWAAPGSAGMTRAYNPPQEQFDANVAEHSMEVVRDDGVHRFIRFRRKESSTYWFDLITWPGQLCISGDMGTYVFSRVQDMFKFFRGESINPAYWGEKLQSIANHGGYREFDEDTFKERVWDFFEQYWEDTDFPDARETCRKDIQDELDTIDFSSEHEAYNWVFRYDFRYGTKHRFQFQDFFDGGGTERYSFSYIWCLRAIVRGIQQYDSEKGKS